MAEDVAENNEAENEPLTEKEEENTPVEKEKDEEDSKAEEEEDEKGNEKTDEEKPTEDDGDEEKGEETNEEILEESSAIVTESGSENPDDENQKETDGNRHKEVFDVFQEDEKVPVERIGCMIRSLGFNPLDEEIEEIIKPYVDDSVESIGFPEFEGIVIAEEEKRKDVDEDKRFKDAFETLDKEKKGTISKAELKEVLTTMGSMKLSESEADDMIEKLEFDDEDNISHDLIIKLLRS